MRRSGVVLAVVVVMLVLAPIASARPLATVAWDRYDVDIQIQPNGTFIVTEIQTIRFGGGQSYRKGFAVIPQERGTIGEVKVWEGSQVYVPSFSQQPYTFETYHNEDGDLEIVWFFPPTVNTAHTFNLQYTVSSGLLYYPDRGYDRLQWKAVPYDHDYPIAAALVMVRLPNGAPILRAGASSDSPAAYSVSSDQLSATFESNRSLAPGEGVEVRVDFEHGVVTGIAPDWQARYDLQEEFGPLLGVLSLFLGALIAVGGSLLVLLRWYTRGRDPQVGLAAEYVSEPPSDLAPGLAGTLLDERADMPDILATLIDLARRGLITMEETQTEGFMGIGTSRDFIFRRVPDAATASLLNYERQVLNAVLPGDERRLSELKYKFYQNIPTIQNLLYGEAVSAGLFPKRPDSVRSQWAVGGSLLFAVAVIGAIGAILLLGDVSMWVIVPFIGLAVVATVMIASAAAMPVKTRHGAEAAAAWLAFKRYLSNLEKYTQVQEATDQFERYLPYAIAFGLERSWINRFARLDTVPMPMWYRPYGWRGGYYGRPIGDSPSMGTGGNMPSVQGMSDGLAGSLSSMSAGFTSMLNSASSTFSSVPQSSGSGGGWSGGGFSGGGGGGGGSRGFG